MTTKNGLNPASKPAQTIHWASIAQFILSLLAAMTAWGIAIMLGMMGLVVVFGESQGAALADAQLLIAAGSFLAGFILLASAGFALLRLLGRPVEFPLKRGQLWRTLALYLPLILTPLVIGVGYLVISYLYEWAWLLLPPIHVLAVGLPVLWLVMVAVNRLPLGSPQRVGGLLGSGLTLSPGIILILELVVLIFLAIGATIFFASQESMAREVMTIANRLDWARTESDMLRILEPIITRPAVIFTVLAYIAGIVPLIEELLKPLGVWLLAGRKLTPAAGFAAGALSGAAYGLFENFALTQSFDGWTLVTVTRIGTTILHIATTAMMGWALASAWGQRKYLRLGLISLGAAGFHGLWNATAILDGISPIYQELRPDHWLAILSPWLPYFLVVYTICAFVTLILMRKWLSAQENPPPEPNNPPSLDPAETLITNSLE